MSKPKKILLITDAPWKFFFPWVDSSRADVAHADEAFWFSRRDLALRLLYKLHPDEKLVYHICIKRILRRYKKIVVCELNRGQFAAHLRSKIENITLLQYNKVQGQPFTASELKEHFTQLLAQ